MLVLSTYFDQRLHYEHVEAADVSLLLRLAPLPIDRVVEVVAPQPPHHLLLLDLELGSVHAREVLDRKPPAV